MPHCSISGQSEIQSEDEMPFPATLDVPTNHRENMLFTVSTWIYVFVVYVLNVIRMLSFDLL